MMEGAIEGRMKGRRVRSGERRKRNDIEGERKKRIDKKNASNRLGKKKEI